MSGEVLVLLVGLVAVGVAGGWDRARRHNGAETGQSLVEYAVIVALIGIALMVTVKALGSEIAQAFQRILAGVQGI
jgi:Flp pilus assembly pilin Flp